MCETLLIVACGKTKADTSRGPLPAKELYQGQLFKARAEYAERSGEPWMILSAKHGLISPETSILGYDVTIEDLNDDTRSDVQESIIKQLIIHFRGEEGIGGQVIEIHAGADYVELIREVVDDFAPQIVLPTEGMGIGEQLGFYKKKLGELKQPVPAPLPVQFGSRPATTATIHYSDCIRGMWDMLPEEIVDLTVSSIPFEELFTYSGKLEDVGNNGSTRNLREGRFALNLRFFIRALWRVTKPGHNACIHIQQLLAYKNQHGFIGRRDFRGAVIDLFHEMGWHWKGEFVIAKNPQAMAQRLNLHCLMFATGKRNGRDLAPCPNDYVLIFQKPGEAQPSACLRDGEENPNGWLTTEEWIRDACGIWTDIDEFDVIGGKNSRWLKGVRTEGLKENDQEKHVCPLQLEVIRRLIKLYTAPGEVVLDPFMGIGSTAVVALEQGRYALGFELKESYHKGALENAELQRQFMSKPTDLFPAQ